MELQHSLILCAAHHARRDPLRFLFVAYSAFVADIAWQVKKEGHDARLCIQDEAERGIGDRWAEDSDKLHNRGYLRES